MCVSVSECVFDCVCVHSRVFLAIAVHVCTVVVWSSTCLYGCGLEQQLDIGHEIRFRLCFSRPLEVR